jgi:hypothetical protein
MARKSYCGRQARHCSADCSDTGLGPEGPYTGAVEENTKWCTRSATALSRSDRLAEVLLRSYLRGSRTDSGAIVEAAQLKDASDVVVAQEPSDEHVIFQANFQEIIQDHGPESRFQQLQHGVASDIARAARDQNARPSRSRGLVLCRGSSRKGSRTNSSTTIR